MVEDSGGEEREDSRVDGMRKKLQRMRAYVDDLEEGELPSTPQAWEKMIESLKGSIQVSSDLLDQLDGYEDDVKEINTIRDDMEEVRKKSQIQEFRIQQFEDKGQRAIDFIHEHGHDEQFRRYYEKKKEINVISFPQDD